MSQTDRQTDTTELTVQLLSSYLANNLVPSEDLPDLIRTTKAALMDETPSVPAAAPPPKPVAAVSIRRSLASRDHILSLIDGRPYKTLKRHLAKHGLTPESYRELYDLAKDYPMVAPAFAERRRAIAATAGLGRRVGSTSPSPESEAFAESTNASVKTETRRSSSTRRNLAKDEKVVPPLDGEPLSASGTGTRKRRTLKLFRTAGDAMDESSPPPAVSIASTPAQRTKSPRRDAKKLRA